MLHKLLKLSFKIWIHHNQHNHNPIIIYNFRSMKCYGENFSIYFVLKVSNNLLKMYFFNCLQLHCEFSLIIRFHSLCFKFTLLNDISFIPIEICLDVWLKVNNRFCILVTKKIYDHIYQFYIFVFQFYINVCLY